MSTHESELGAPPQEGLVVRPQDEGFYVRLQPLPAPQTRRVMAVVLMFGGVGTAIALASSDVARVRAWIALGSVAFGLLLWALSYGQGFFPLELVGDDRTLSWSGERFAWSGIVGATADGGTLVLWGPQSRELARASHLHVEAADWVARLITASAEG